MNQSLPPNPYPAFSEELRSQFYAPSELSYDLQIACLTGIFGLCLVLVLASLGIRYWTKTFWVFATRKTVAGTWIVPHPIVTWSIMLGVLFTLLIPYTRLIWRYGHAGQSLNGTFFWRATVWTPLWIGAFLMAWATALGPIISRQPRQSSRFDPAHYPLVANILLILIPSLFVASIVPLSWVLGRTFDKCFAMFLALDSRLVQAGINYEQGPFMDSTGLEMMVVQLKAQSDDVSMAWRNTWLVWCSYIVILFAFFTYACVSQYHYLGKKLDALKARSTGPAYTTQRRSLTSAYRSLLLTFLISLFMMTGYFGIALIPVVHSKDLKTGDELATDVSLASLWITAVFGTLSVVVTFIRSFSSSPTAPTARIMTQSLQETPLDSLPRHMRHLYSNASIESGSDERHTMASEVEVELGGYGGKGAGVKVPERAQYKFR